MKVLFSGTFTDSGAKGLVKEGAASRRTSVEKAVASVGGRLECYYYALGAEDLWAIVDLPDTSAALALSIAVAASGAGRLKTIPLVSVEEFDRARTRPVDYRPMDS
jgi:uncharacterized protein with GYD domain